MALSPLDDCTLVADLLRSGDRLVLCYGVGWRLLYRDEDVSEEVIRVLRPNLAPLDDGLPGLGDAQTWIWTENDNE